MQEILDKLPEIFAGMTDSVPKVIGYLSTLSGGSLLVYIIVIGKVTKLMIKLLSWFITIGIIFLVIAYWDQIYSIITQYIPAELGAILNQYLGPGGIFG